MSEPTTSDALGVFINPNDIPVADSYSREEVGPAEAWGWNACRDHILAMCDDANPVAPEHQVRLLGQALGRVLVAAGAASDIPLTGPQLLLLADDYIEHLTGARP